MKIKNYLHESNNNEWYTPGYIIDDVYQVLGTIDFDPFSNHYANTIVQATHYYTIDNDALQQSWHNGKCFINPPYSRALINNCINKSIEHLLLDGNAGVILINVATDTKWFHDYIYNHAEVRFIKGRLKFSGAEHNAPFPSMIVVFNPI